MKKFGFTLMEAILTIGIIGVVAAIATPLLNNVIPDKDKIAVLKIYKTIQDINQEIMDDPKWRHSEMCQAVGGNGVLACISATVQDGEIQPAPSVMMVPINSYGLIFSTYIDTVGNNDYSNFYNGFTPITFTSTDGHQWQIIMANGTHWTAANGFIINVDLMDEKKSRCVYSENCTKPGQFNFIVNERGIVKGGDPLTSAYIANAGKLNDKKNDYKTAKNDKKEYKTPVVKP